MKRQWTSVTDEQSRRFAKFRERRSQIDKDVVRTDRKHELFAGEDNPNLELLRSALITYSFYNFDLVRALYGMGGFDSLCVTTAALGDWREARERVSCALRPHKA